MSKIDFKPPVGGTGVFSFVPPATNTDRTINLPDAGGQLHTSESVNDHATMPTVAGDPIVESGSNSDGEWTRWADGTQVCKTTKVASASATSIWDYPQGFTDEMQAQATANSAVALFGNVSSVGFLALNFDVWGTGGARNASSCILTVHGRWK